MYVEYRQGEGVGFSGPLPISYTLQAVGPPAPEVLKKLRVPGGPLLELPVREAVDGSHDAARAMYRSTYHWRRLLNGYDGYWPAGFPERMTLARALPDAAALERLRRESGLELVLVRSAELCDGERETWLELAARGGGGYLHLIARSESELLFRVTDAPPDADHRLPPAPRS
jgi:hypothetical protein